MAPVDCFYVYPTVSTDTTTVSDFVPDAPLDIHVLPETSHPNFPMASRDAMVALMKAFLANPAAGSRR